MVLRRMALNALLVNAGRRVELLRMLRQACRGLVVAVDIDALAPTLYHADVAEPVPVVADPEFVTRLIGLCRAHNVSLVVPTTDRELPVLSRRVHDFAALGARVAIAPSSAIDTALDKLSCASTLNAAGVPAVPTEEWPTEGYPPFAFPVVVKPRRGAASEGVRVIDAPRQWTAPPPGTDWVVQPRASGPEVTIDVLADGDNRIAAIGARKRLKVRAGEVERAHTVSPEPYLSLARRVARALSLVGPFNFQVFTGGEIALVGEVNPRLGGGLPLSERAGATVLEGLCRWALLGQWQVIRPGMARPDVYMARYDCSIFLESQELAW